MRKLVSATNVARSGKRVNICVGNNVSSFAWALKLPNSKRQQQKLTSATTWRQHNRFDQTHAEIPFWWEAVMAT